MLRILLLATGLQLFVCVPGFSASPVDEPPPQLEPVRVISHLDVQASGKSTLTRSIIDRLPRGNGSITELLGVLPDVQFSENSRPSKQGGEILPPEVSISGGKFFQNLFAINGISNDSLLDPTAVNPTSQSEVPGHSQELFLDASLVDRVEVYDANIPARYGDFTGGVIDARLRSPGPRFSGHADYRTTRDDWTEFYLHDEQRYQFDTSNSASRQPRFVKHDAGIGFDLPVAERIGLQFDYRQLYSEIPLQLLDQTETQTRRNQNLLLRSVVDLDAASYLDASVVYAPYQAEYFIPDARNSRFEIDGGGYRGELAYRHISETLEYALQAAYRFSENSRTAPQDWRLWAATDSHDWGRIVQSAYSREGGFGDLEKQQQNLDLTAEVSWEPAPRGDLRQQVTAGLGYQRTLGSYRRPEDATVYTDSRTTPDVICGADLFACVDGEQFFTLRTTYQAVKLEETINSGYLFADDRVGFGRLEVRPGVRLSYDDFLGNLNLAPRLSTRYDLFGSGQTLLIGGLNRYYGKVPLAFKLREALRPPASAYRTTDLGVVTEWFPDPLGLSHVARFSPLDTPFTDEAMLGVDQALVGGRLTLKWIRRYGRDEFARSFGPEQADGLRYYTMTNDGSSDTEIYRAAWERSWSRQTLLLSWTHQRSLTSNEDFNTLLDEAGYEPRVWYNGGVVYKSELPRSDFNRPDVGRLFYSCRLPGGFEFSNLTRYLAGFEVLEDTGLDVAVPAAQRRVDARTGTVEESLPLYETAHYGNEWIFDWKLSWQHAWWQSLTSRLSVEINNVFNRRIESADEPGSFQLGRQFWVGVEGRF